MVKIERWLAAGQTRHFFSAFVPDNSEGPVDSLKNVTEECQGKIHDVRN